MPADRASERPLPPKPQSIARFAGWLPRKQKRSDLARAIEQLRQQNAQLKRQLAAWQQQHRQQTLTENALQQLKQENSDLKQQIADWQYRHQRQSRYYRTRQAHAEQTIEQLEHQNVQLRQQLAEWQVYSSSVRHLQPLPETSVSSRSQSNNFAASSARRALIRDRTPPKTPPRDRSKGIPFKLPPFSQKQFHSTKQRSRRRRKSRLDRFVIVATIALVLAAFSGAVWQRSQTLQANRNPLGKSNSANLRNPSSPHQKTSKQYPKRLYNVSTAPHFQQSEELQTIVQSLVDLIATRGLPTEALSITLIDVRSLNAGNYQHEQLRFPASIIKLFWMVILYDQIQSGTWPNEDAFASDLSQMIQKSSNDAGSRILDQITNTESGKALAPEEFEMWQQKREQINWFFQAAGYDAINISQKVFPIATLQLNDPQGRDLQIRGNLHPPRRNQISTQHAARLMYEIATGQAISEKYSRKMARWLYRDLQSTTWQRTTPGIDEFNPIQTFFGEALPADVQLLSKAGWTSESRQEVAYISTQDDSTAYVLAIFGEDAKYSQDKTLFPFLSQFVFENMIERNR